MPESHNELAPKLPLRIGRYVLCEELGAGGMATVYLSRMELAANLERLVALKTIHRHLAKQRNFVDMFLDEARIASQISHPNVCSVYDFGESNGTYYLAMEYLSGEPLFELVNRLVEHVDDPSVLEMLPCLAARIVADACEGLHAAHEASGPNGEPLGIVHRDVSPQNLFVTYEGSVKVVDFGCAKAIERVAQTSDGTLKGKVSYASPEQLQNEPVDARTDVWALGVCLWETLTLGPLFWRDSPMLIAMAVIEGPIPLASKERKWVPAEVARIAARALSRDPSKRYANARDMGRDLRQFIAQSGFTLEDAELAEWMSFLFGARMTERQRMVARAREVDVSNVHAMPVVVRTAPPPPDPEPAAVSGRSSVPIERAQPRRRWPWVMLALVAVAIGGVYYAWYERYIDLPFDLDGATVGAFASPGRDRHPPTKIAEPAEPEQAPGTANAPETANVSDEVLDAGSAQDAGSDAGRRHHESAPPVTTVVAQSGSVQNDYAPATNVAPATDVAPGEGTTGSVSIEADNGWALIYLGSRLLGRTPLHTELPVGHHRLRILPYGQEPADYQSVDVEEAFDVSLRISVADPAAAPAP